MEKEKQKQIASKGGKAAHQKGTAHEFTSDEARRAGSKGGKASQAKRQQLKLARTGAGGAIATEATVNRSNAVSGGMSEAIGANIPRAEGIGVAAQGVDIFAILQNDHRTVSHFMSRMLGAAAGDFILQDELYPNLRRELEIHSSAEEQTVYPKLRESTPDLAEEAVREHDEVRDLLARLDSLYGGEEGTAGQRDTWIQVLTELRDTVEHHVSEEESEIFEALRSRCSMEELTQLANRFRQAKENLQKSQEQAA